MFDCLTFSVSMSIFVLPFEWPQTLPAMWAFMRSLLLTLMWYCLQFSIWLQFLCCTCYKHVCRLQVECCINKLLLLLFLLLLLLPSASSPSDTQSRWNGGYNPAILVLVTLKINYCNSLLNVNPSFPNHDRITATCPPQRRCTYARRARYCFINSVRPSPCPIPVLCLNEQTCHHTVWRYGKASF